MECTFCNAGRIIKHHVASRLTITQLPLGCGACFSLDGNWKLTFPHCMYPVKTQLLELPKLNFPDVCTEQLSPGLAFCEQHSQLAAVKGYPTKIRDFLKFCGVSAPGRYNL